MEERVKFDFDIRITDGGEIQDRDLRLQSMNARRMVKRNGHDGQ